MIDYHRLKDWPFPEVEHTYSADDTLFYALAIGLGAEPVDERQLQFVNDTVPGTPLAFPTMAVTLAYPGSWMSDPATGIDFPMIVHGEETVEWERPIPAFGTVAASHRVTHVVDKGAGRGATVTYEKELTDRASGDLIATVRHTTFCRGDGGFSTRDGVSDPAPPAPARVPERKADREWEFRTLPQQALLYRLCADRNPLHSDPAVARKAGFERPILHGLATYGIAGHAMLASWCGYDPARLRRLATRFSAPVLPGETLRFEMYDEGAEVAFRARVVERDKVVLDYGRAEFTR
jgi:acyl dehydratase